MNIEINGKNHTFSTALTLSELLQALDMGSERIAIEVNGEIVPRAEHSSRQAADGDRIEIVHAIGGGQGGLSASTARARLAPHRDVGPDGVQCEGGQEPDRFRVKTYA